MSEESSPSGTEVLLELSVVIAGMDSSLRDTRDELRDTRKAIEDHHKTEAEHWAVQRSLTEFVDAMRPLLPTLQKIAEDERFRGEVKRKADEREEGIKQWLTTPKGLAFSGAIIATLSSILGQYFPWLQAIFDALTLGAATP